MPDLLNEQWLEKRIKHINFQNKFMKIFAIFILSGFFLFVFYSIKTIVMAWQAFHPIMNQKAYTQFSGQVLNLFIIGSGGIVISLVSLLGLSVIIYLYVNNERKYLRIINELKHEILKK